MSCRISGVAMRWRRQRIVRVGRSSICSSGLPRQQDAEIRGRRPLLRSSGPMSLRVRQHQSTSRIPSSAYPELCTSTSIAPKRFIVSAATDLAVQTSVISTARTCARLFSLKTSSIASGDRAAATTVSPASSAARVITHALLLTAAFQRFKNGAFGKIEIDLHPACCIVGFAVLD